MNEADGIRVVVVDDNPDEAESLAEMVRLNGYWVRVGTNAQAALALAADYQPHCMMLDIDMPDMNGIELARRLRSQQGDDLVIIAVTGWGDDSEIFAATNAEVDHYLRKPVAPSKLNLLLPDISTS